MITCATLRILADAGDSLEQAENKLAARWESFVDFLPVLAIGAGILVLAFLIGLLIDRSSWPWSRITKNAFLADILQQIARLAIFLLALVLALDVIGAGSLLGALLGTAGLLGLVIGFAFREIAENFFASLLLSLKQPFAPNEHVVIDGEEGKVVRLTTRATVLMTLDGNHLRIPNSRVYKATILNYTRNPMRRFSFAVGVGTTEDLETVEDVGLAAVRSLPGVAEDPPPFYRIDVLGDSTVTVKFFVWVDQRRFDLGKVKSVSIRSVKEAFDAKGITMPEPAYRLIGAEPPAAGAPESTGAKQKTPERRLPPTDVEMEEVEVDHYLEDQIEDDRREADAPDLLQPDAPRE